MDKLDLIIQGQQNLANEIHELRDQSISQTTAIVALEVKVNSLQGHCRIQHENLDKRLEELDGFKDTGTHDLKALQLAEQRREDFRKWGIRLLLGIPVAVLVSACALILKGCLG